MRAEGLLGVQVALSSILSKWRAPAGCPAEPEIFHLRFQRLSQAPVRRALCCAVGDWCGASVQVEGEGPGSGVQDRGLLLDLF